MAGSLRAVGRSENEGVWLCQDTCATPWGRSLVPSHREGVSELWMGLRRKEDLAVSLSGRWQPPGVGQEALSVTAWCSLTPTGEKGRPVWPRLGFPGTQNAPRPAGAAEGTRLHCISCGWDLKGRCNLRFSPPLALGQYFCSNE